MDFDVVPECPKCYGKGTIVVSERGPQPDLSDNPTGNITFILWLGWQVRCSECDGRGTVKPGTVR